MVENRKIKLPNKTYLPKKRILLWLKRFEKYFEKEVKTINNVELEKKHDGSITLTVNTPSTSFTIIISSHIVKFMDDIEMLEISMYINEDLIRDYINVVENIYQIYSLRKEEFRENRRKQIEKITKRCIMLEKEKKTIKADEITEYEALQMLKEWTLPEDWVFSPSQFSKFTTCPFSWALRYALNVEENKTFLGTAIGIAFHRILERKYKEGIKKDEVNFKEELLKVIKELEDEGKYIDWAKPKKPKFVKMSIEEWKDYLIDETAERMAIWFDNMPNFLNVESEKEIDMTEILGIKFKGIADLIAEDIITSEKILYDFKTTYSSGYFSPESYREQLTAYMLGENIKKAKIIALYRSEKDIPLEIIDVEPIDKELLKERLYEMERAVKYKVFPKKKRGTKGDMSFCLKVCSYRKICFPDIED